MVTLCILDGFGIKKDELGNAIIAAGTPNLDKLKNEYPFDEIQASGEEVGLPAGQMGNSEDLNHCFEHIQKLLLKLHF